MTRIRLRLDDLAVELAPEVGGSVARYDVRRGGEPRPLFRPAPDGSTDVLESACFPLVPYSNRVRDGRFSFRGRDVRLSPNMLPQRHPLHGMGWRAPWRVEAAEETAAVLAFEWGGGEWPWPFRARQSFTLDPQGFRVALTVENTGDGPMPAGLGLHPYHPCPPGTVLDAAVGEVLPVDAELYPTGERLPAQGRYALRERAISGAGLDNGYGGWEGVATLRWPDGLALRLTSDVTWFQVYAPVDAPLLAAEPVSHANGALNAPETEQAGLGLRVLEPGESFTLAARFDPLR